MTREVGRKRTADDNFDERLDAFANSRSMCQEDKLDAILRVIQRTVLTNRLRRERWFLHYLLYLVQSHGFWVVKFVPVELEFKFFCQEERSSLALE